MYDIPKVINLFGQDSYHERFPQLMIKFELPFFIGLRRYDITIPIRKQATSDFNIFERAVIKLCALGINTPEIVADTVCIPIDLANFIFSRLVQLDIIEANGTLTKQGEKYLDISDSEEKTEMMTASIFATEKGEFLPLVLTEKELCYENAEYIVEKDEQQQQQHYILLHTGSAGGNVNIKAPVLGRLNNDKEKVRNHLPTQEQVRKILDSYNNYLTGQTRSRIDYVNGRMIEITFFNTVYFLARAAKQRGNVDTILCSEGMLINNDVLGQMVDYNFRAQLDSEASVTEKDIEIQSAEVQPYEEIIRNLPVVIRPAQSNDEQIVNEKTMNDNIRKALAMMEHAFNYYLKKNPPSEWAIKKLQKNSADENDEMLTDFLISMGAEIEGVNTHVIELMDSERYTRYRNTKVPDIYVVVPLAIAEAATNPNSTVRSMIKDCPRFLDCLATLTKFAGKFRHGVNTDVKITEGLHNHLCSMTGKMVCAILPDAELDGKARQENHSVVENQERAYAALASELGATRFYTLNSFIRNELLKTSPDKSDAELPNASEMAISFSLILENLLANECRNLPGKLDSDKEKALERLKELSGKPVPEGLATVSEKNIRIAATRSGGSLGSLTLCYILNGNKVKVRRFLEKDFHLLVSEIATLRGHGNGVMLNTKGELKNLRARVYEFISFFGGNV